MLHIGKYFAYIFNGAGAILFYPHMGKKYLKTRDEYSLKERYDFVNAKAKRVLNKYLKVKLDIKGLEKLNSDDTYLFTPNHQSMLDPVLLLDIIEKPIVFVCKKETEKYPIIGKVIRMIDGIFLDRESPRDALKMVKSCREYLANGTNVVIFPEGTRSKDEKISIHEYKPGAFKCVYGTEAKVVPVVIDKSSILLSTRVKNTDKVIKISFLDPIDKEEYLELNTTELAKKVEELAKKELEEMRKE